MEILLLQYEDLEKNSQKDIIFLTCIRRWVTLDLWPFNYLRSSWQHCEKRYLWTCACGENWSVCPSMQNLRCSPEEVWDPSLSAKHPAKTVEPALMAQLDARPTGNEDVAGLTPAGLATFFHGDWWWNIFYDHSLPSTDSRRAVCQCLAKESAQYWLTL